MDDIRILLPNQLSLNPTLSTLTSSCPSTSYVALPSLSSASESNDPFPHSHSLGSSNSTTSTSLINSTIVMDLDTHDMNQDASTWVHLVTPGETIVDDPQFMKGHGAYIENETMLVANVQGVVERVNKLVSVRPLRTRYSGDIGDVVVGRITEVGQKRWKVDIHARQDAVLQLSSIHLPGGIQRRKSESDELAMRHYFTEGDIVIAEVHQLHSETGVVSLHTRSLLYGQRRHALGTLVIVPPQFIPRLKSHFCSFLNPLELVLGMNGWIWIQVKSKPSTSSSSSATSTTSSSLYTPRMNPHFNTNEKEEGGQNDTKQEEKGDLLIKLEKMARLKMCIHILVLHQQLITEAALMALYQVSLQYTVHQLHQFDIMKRIFNEGWANLTSSSSSSSSSSSLE